MGELWLEGLMGSHFSLSPAPGKELCLQHHALLEVLFAQHSFCVKPALGTAPCFLPEAVPASELPPLCQVQPVPVHGLGPWKASAMV